MSDIHGNLGAFKRAVADAKKRKCQKIICLGDLTGYGKQSKECVEYAMQNVDMCLMGNHDSACCELEDPDAVAENRNFDVDVATRRLLTFGQMAWLMARPHIWCCPAFACTHGDFTSPKEWLYIVDPKDARPSLLYRSEPVLFVGHTHIPSLMKISAEDAALAGSFDEDDMVRGLRGLKEIGPQNCMVSGGARYVVNVGSVGLPREGPCGTYCTYDVQNGKLQFVFLRNSLTNRLSARRARG